MSKTLSSQLHFIKVFLKRKRLQQFYFNFFHQHKAGTIVRVWLTLDYLPFTFVCFLKSGGLSLFSKFLNFYIYEGMCIATRKRGLGSSITIRFVEDGVSTDRSALIFSPNFVKVVNVYNSLSLRYAQKQFKAKLYFLKAFSQKKLLSRLYV